MSSVAAALAIAMVTALAGCASSAGDTEPAAPAAQVAPPATATGAEIRLELGRMATFEDGALEITFSEVTADSRCPKGETCVWEGDAVARFAVRSGAGSGVIELHTASRAPHAAGFAGWRIELLALEPAPITGKPVPQVYVATLRVERGDAMDNAVQ